MLWDIPGISLVVACCTIDISNTCLHSIRIFFFGISHIWSEQVNDENKGIDSVFGDTSIPVVTVDLCKQFCWKQHPFLQRHASGRLRSYSISRAAPPLCNCSNGSSCSCGAAVAAATAGVLAPAAVAAAAALALAPAAALAALTAIVAAVLLRQADRCCTSCCIG